MDLRAFIPAVAVSAIAILIGTPTTFRILIRLTGHDTHLSWQIAGYVSDAAILVALLLFAGGYAGTLKKAADHAR